METDARERRRSHLDGEASAASARNRDPKRPLASRLVEAQQGARQRALALGFLVALSSAAPAWALEPAQALPAEAQAPEPPAPRAGEPSAASQAAAAAGADVTGAGQSAPYAPPPAAAPGVAAPAPGPAEVGTIPPPWPTENQVPASTVPTRAGALEATRAPAAAAPSTEAWSPDDDADAFPKLELRARVHARYAYTNLEPPHHFDLRRARLGLEFQPSEALSAELDIDASEAPPLKDAFVTAEAHRAFRVSAGQFKKPFSRLELMSPGRLPLLERGMTNAALVRGQGFGGRDIGLAIGGRAAFLRYDFGVFNGNKSAAEIDAGKDLALRLEAKPAEPLSVGLSGAMKYRNVPNVDYARNDLWAAGGDVRLRIGRLEAIVEAVGAQGTASADGPWQLGVLGYATYRLRLAKGLRLLPLVKAELLDDDVSSSNDHALALGAGANLHAGKLVRVFLQGEHVSAEAESTTPEDRRVTLGLAFDSSYSLALASGAAKKRSNAP